MARARRKQRDYRLVIRLNNNLHQVLQSASVLRNTELGNGNPTQITPQCILEVNLHLHHWVSGRE